MKTPADFPKLNLPACRLRVAERAGETLVWDTLRGRWLVLTPEEWVRRHVLAYLSSGGADHIVGEKIIPAAIAQEHPVELNGTHQRADIVVFGAHSRPLLLVECKAPQIEIDDSAREQAFRYNTVLRARHIMITNGLETIISLSDSDPHFLFGASMHPPK